MLVMLMNMKEREKKVTNAVRAYFKLRSGEKISYSKSDDRHTTAQHILCGLIMNKEPIRVNYRDIPFNLCDLNLDIKNKTTEHILEQSYIEKEIGINRRADLLFELEEPNLTFGRGLVFEIVNSEDMSSIKEKSKDWARAGYSLIAIPINNFDFIEYGLKKDNYIIMYQLFDDLNLYLELTNKKLRFNATLLNKIILIKM